MITIEPIHLNDLDELQRISQETFYASYAEANTEANTQAYMNKWFSKEQLSSELKNDSSAFYFARKGGNAIGYLKVNWGSSQSEMKDQNSMEIERIYVLKAYQRQHIGQELLAKAFEVASSKQLDFVWLGVWENNLSAIQFYAKMGFIAFGTHGFLFGDEVQTDLLMKFTFRDKTN